MPDATVGTSTLPSSTISHNQSSDAQKPVLTDLPSFELDQLFFFYGTLTIPHIIQEILSLPIVTLSPAIIHGYTLKMWGPYPALVPSQSDSKVDGMLFRVVTEKQFRKLERYEGENYQLVRCRVKVEGESLVVDAWTFIWDGTDEELKDGTFDATLFPRRIGRRRARASP